MSKFLNIFCLLLVIIILLAPTFVQALGVNMNLDNNMVANSTSTTNSTTSTTSQTNSTNKTNTPQYYTTSSSTVGTLESLPEANLGLSNILSIILIVIGILLILLSIAIIIRLKH